MEAKSVSYVCIPEDGTPLNVPAGKLRVLCLDGGGIRGLVELQFLKALEKRTGKRINEIFDVICGTSTGGLIALAIGTCDFSLVDCEELYKLMARDIFDAQTAILKVGAFFEKQQSMYSSTKLEHVMKVVFGSDTPIPVVEDTAECTRRKVFVVASKFNVIPESCFLFRNYTPVSSTFEGTSDAKLWEAARATSAAPIYFTPTQVGEMFLRDGGLQANNPSELLFDEFGTEALGLIVSLGTGQSVGTSRADLFQTTPELILDFLELLTQSHLSHNRTRNRCRDHAIPYLRFDPILKDPIPMDCGKESTLRAMIHEVGLTVDHAFGSPSSEAEAAAFKALLQYFGDVPPLPAVQQSSVPEIVIQPQSELHIGTLQEVKITARWSVPDKSPSDHVDVRCFSPHAINTIVCSHHIQYGMERHAELQVPSKILRYGSNMFRAEYVKASGQELSTAFSIDYTWPSPGEEFYLRTTTPTLRPGGVIRLEAMLPELKDVRVEVTAEDEKKVDKLTFATEKERDKDKEKERKVSEPCVIEVAENTLKYCKLTAGNKKKTLSVALYPPACSYPWTSLTLLVDSTYHLTVQVDPEVLTISWDVPWVLETDVVVILNLADDAKLSSIPVTGKIMSAKRTMAELGIQDLDKVRIVYSSKPNTFPLSKWKTMAEWRYTKAQ